MIKRIKQVKLELDAHFSESSIVYHINKPIARKRDIRDPKEKENR
jgi:hypothetical protein